MDDSSNLFKFLKTVPLLAGLPDARLAHIANICWTKNLPRGRVVFCQGDPAEAFYIIKSGQVAEFISVDGVDVEALIKERRSGDFFGEMGILLNEPELVTVLTLQDCSLVILKRDDFLDLVKTQTSVANSLLLTFARRVKYSGEQHVIHLFMEAPGRLAYTILRLEHEEGSLGSVSVTQDYLAQRCSLARQTTARILGEWRMQGWISTHRGRLEIINRSSISQFLEATSHP